jgi:hypothetical protein
MRPERIARAYHASRRVEQKTLDAVDAVFTGLWLGAMGDGSRGAADAAYYEVAREPVGDRRLGYRDEGYARRGLFEWEEAAIAAHFPAAGRIVVTGAGSGREILALLERGYDAYGYDPDAALVAAGRPVVGGDRLRVCDPDAFPESGTRNDGVVIGWSSYMHVMGRNARIALLRGARVTLAPRSPILLSFFMRQGGEKTLRLTAATANVIRRFRGSAPAELGDTIGNVTFHLFTAEEIEAELAAGGFELVELHREPYAHAIARASA